MGDKMDRSKENHPSSLGEATDGGSLAEDLTRRCVVDLKKKQKKKIQKCTADEKNYSIFHDMNTLVHY